MPGDGSWDGGEARAPIRSNDDTLDVVPGAVPADVRPAVFDRKVVFVEGDALDQQRGSVAILTEQLCDSARSVDGLEPLAGTDDPGPVTGGEEIVERGVLEVCPEQPGKAIG